MKWTGPDDQRPLSARGRAQAEALGNLLAAAGQTFDRIISSPRLRTRQTAELVADRLDLKVVIDQRLGGALDLAGIEAILRDAGDPDRPILVGHDPDMTELVSDLSGAELISMRKGAFARIDSRRPLARGSGELKALLPPDLLARDSARRA